MKKDHRQIPSSKLRQALHDAADSEGRLPVRSFVEIALYHPTEGYYRKSPASRVGRRRETDFYTSASLKNAFAKAIVEAASKLCADHDFYPAETVWLEIGAEPGDALLAELEHPFAEARSLGASDPLELSGQLMVFSNELFDAQGFDTLVFHKGQWKQECVAIDANGIRPTLRTLNPNSETELPPNLPNVAPEGYRIDLPTGSRDLLRRIAQQDWQGAFIAFDYGKTWPALTRDTPQGTARAYRAHQQRSDIYADAGQQDITHHICWDWLESELERGGFASIALESQEAFIINRARNLLAAAFSEESLEPNGLKPQLRQLIHPTLMGQKFQVLSAARRTLDSAV